MPGKKFAVGIDLGGTSVKIGLVDLNGKIVKKLVKKSDSAMGPAAVLRQIKDGVHEITGDKIKISGIGIGAPGTVGIINGTVQDPPNFPGWGTVRIGSIIKKEFKCNVFVENDANAAAIGELIYGAGRQIKNFIMITLGTGVGGGIIIDRKIYRGESGGAGELGHVTIDTLGHQCNCGSIGCIEAYIGNNYLIERVKRLLNERTDSMLYKTIRGDFSLLTPKLIHTAAQAGDDFSQSVVIDTGTKLGYALASVVNVLDITTIILGGGISGFGKLLYSSVESSLIERVMKPFRSRIKIKQAKLRNDAGIKGASALVHYKS